MAGKQPSYSDLLKLAKRYGVEQNEMFVSACLRYVQINEMIDNMRAVVDKQGYLMARTNVKGDINLDANPLLPQIAKHADTANKTLSLMLDIINRLGHEPDKSDGLELNLDV